MHETAENAQVSDDNAGTAPRRGLVAVLRDSVVALILVGLIGGGVVAGVAELQRRAAAEPGPSTAAPITVNVRAIAIDPGYDVERRYVGRLEAARTIDAAFDLGGRVMRVHVDEGDPVVADQPLANLDTARLAVARRQLEAQVKELEARRELAKLTLGRQQRLNRREFASAQRVDEARTQVTETTAAIERLQAEIDRVDLDIEKSELKAPFAGVVGARSVDEGAVVTAGTPVLTLLETDAQEARIGLPPDIADDLTIGGAFTLQSPTAEVAATLTAIRPDLQQSTRTVTAIFSVAEAPTTIAMGEIVTLSIRQRIGQAGSWVPLTSLKEGTQGLWTVLLVTTNDDGGTVVRPAAVEVLHTEGSRAFVRGTLREGDRLIIDGTHRVVSGQKVAALLRPLALSSDRQ